MLRPLRLTVRDRFESGMFGLSPDNRRQQAFAFHFVEAGENAAKQWQRFDERFVVEPEDPFADALS